MTINVLVLRLCSRRCVGEIRTTVEEILTDIADACYDLEVFKTDQAHMAIEYVRKTYGDELEFLWTKFPDNAVWRRKDSRKCYGAILTVSGEKIGLDTEKIVEIIDILAGKCCNIHGILYNNRQEVL